MDGGTTFREVSDHTGLLMLCVWFHVKMSGVRLCWCASSMLGLHGGFTFCLVGFWMCFDVVCCGRCVCRCCVGGDEEAKWHEFYGLGRGTTFGEVSGVNGFDKQL